MKYGTTVGGVTARMGFGTKGAMPIEFVAHLAGVDDEYTAWSPLSRSAMTAPAAR
jgi:hypothetical protein